MRINWGVIGVTLIGLMTLVVDFINLQSKYPNLIEGWFR